MKERQHIITYVRNEERSKVPQALAKLVATRASTSLTLDYGWRGPLGDYEVERKDLSDFIVSLASKHLQDQLYRATQRGLHCSVLIELQDGYHHQLVELAQPWVCAFIASIQTQGIRLLLSPTRDSSALVLYQTYRNDQKLVHTSLAPHKMAKVAPKNKTFLDEVDYVLPEVGDKRTKDIAGRLRHWHGIVTATVEQLRSKEISEHLARKIHGYVRGT